MSRARQSSWDFPWRDNLQPFNGSSDAFVAKLDPSAGGAASLAVRHAARRHRVDRHRRLARGGSAIAADRFGDVYVAGQTTAADFPTAVTTSGIMNGFQPICASCQQLPSTTDAFLVALQESTAQQPSVYFNIGSAVFPAQPVGTQNAPQPVAVHNGGEAALIISSLQITGPNASDFSLIGPAACMGQTIPAGGQCSFEVGFVPSTTGPEAAVVSFTDNAPGNPQVLELIGAGQGAFALLSTTSLNFGSQPENTVESEPCYHDHEHRESGLDAAKPIGVGPRRGPIFPERQRYHLRREPGRRSDLPDRRCLQSQSDWHISRASEPYG